jgi:dihydrofolate reductase
MKGLAFVVAVARNGAIGMDGALPWRIPEDMKHFKRVTLGHAVIMGRKTWESIGKPLVDRRNIVVSRSASIPGVEVVRSVDEALKLAWERDDEPRVIGGAEIYRAALPHATRIYLTEINRDVAADAFFNFDRAEWNEVERRSGEDPAVAYVTLERQ